MEELCQIVSLSLSFFKRRHRELCQMVSLSVSDSLSFFKRRHIGAQRYFKWFQFGHWFAFNLPGEGTRRYVK